MGPIDCHVHLYPPEVNRAPALWAQQQGEHHWGLLCARVRKSGQPVQGFPSANELLHAMDEAGVERVILQGWYWEKHDTCVTQNRFYEACLRAHPERLSACATFHPGAGSAAVESELRWAKDHGFCGLGELSPHSQLFPVDDAVWRSALTLAADLKLPVLLHVTEPGGKGYPGRVLTPLGDFVGLARACPRTTFVLAHWGARLALDPRFAPEACSLENVYYDTAASPLLYDERVFPEMVSAVGATRILFGSDFPLVLFPREDNQPEISKFLTRSQTQIPDPEYARSIFRENARAVFGLC